MSGSRSAPVLIVNPGPDVYGADLQMLQTVGVLVGQGRRVVVLLPGPGPLVERLRAAGAEVVFSPFPVLRRSNLAPRALLVMLAQAAATVVRGTRLVRSLRPAVLVVNTLTLPWWLVVGRLNRVPTVGHVHEGVGEERRLVQRGLVAPLRLADAVIVVGRSALDSLTSVQPRLAGRTSLVHNGVPEPAGEPVPPRRETPFRLAVVGRLSPLKAPDVALEAVAELRARGHDVVIEVAGSTFPGYEWFEDRLRERAARPDLAGAVHFSGYCDPIWPVLERADAVVAPSLREAFGNAVVEAQLAGRPVVATALQGHLETVVDGDTGILVEPGAPVALASGVERLIDDRPLAERLAVRGRSEARRRFSVERYRRDIVATLELVS